ncbi:Protein phosphatase 1 regulatory subunit 16A [Liparis tanakae]|uniref:Protein phosphatase 1 regulatory subunit 16A n=1 Tax=Liparis tanakae TaxID=230148 RepID=A0A4Z2H301_9TELE|nr:Protein phosphatase 1 regulatory subunit 16A [Liparis tanakae]
MAAEHGELLAEMATVGRLSATERLKHAQKRRTQQLKGWAQMEKDGARGSRAKADKKKARTTKVTFPTSITLLDATARNDLEEGNGADLLAVNADGNMPYDLCEDEATLELLEMVMAEQGITQDRIDECRGAKESTMLADIRALLQSDADLNAQDANGATLLHIASANGYVSVAELLLEHRALVEGKDSDGWTPLHAASCWGQIQMVELLVANGASLETKSVLEETPLDVCMDEEVRSKLMDLKHKHDAIMKSQDRQKSTLQRRASSTGSRGKVVRRVSVNERSSLYRREHHKEAMVWQEQRLEELEAADRKIVSSVGNGGSSVSLASSVPGELWTGGGLMERSASYQLCPAPGAGSGSGSTGGEGADSMTREKSHHTLADLKRQRAAAKLNKYPAPPPPLSPPLEEEPSGSAAEVAESEAQPELHVSPSAEEVASPSQVYFTPASGDPPLLKLRAPEEDQSNIKEPCCGLM